LLRALSYVVYGPSLVLLLIFVMGFCGFLGLKFGRAKERISLFMILVHYQYMI
jgi:hypothetical protein